MYIGFDIGGTNIRYAISQNLKKPAEHLFKNSFLHTGNVYSDIEENICKLIDTYENIEGIGISLAANIDRYSGIVKSWPNNPSWVGYNFVKHLKQKYNFPIVIEDDANCGAWGEYILFNSDLDNMIYITVGTGIGCGLIIGKKLFIGDNGISGELGHVILNEFEEQVCCCGQLGCLQSLISGKAILKHYNANRLSLDSAKNVRALIEKCCKNDKQALDSIDFLKRKLTYVIYNLNMILDIGFFVVGGGAGTLYAPFLPEIESEVNTMLKKFKKKVTLSVAQNDQYSGVHGVLDLLEKYLENTKNEKNSSY